MSSRNSSKLGLIWYVNIKRHDLVSFNFPVIFLYQVKLDCLLYYDMQAKIFII